MIRRYLLLFITLIALLCSGTFSVIASDVSDADFYAVASTTNTGDATTDTSSNVTNSVGLTANLISGGFINATATNIALQTATGTDVPIMPGYGSNPWIIFPGDLSSDTVTNSRLYLKNVTGGDIVYFPDSTGMTVVDDATMEPSGNFTASQDCYIDLSQTGDIVFGKPDAYSCNVTGSDELTGYIYQADANVTPTGHVDGASAWADETNAYDGDTGTYANDESITDAWSEYLELTIAPMWTDSVRVWSVKDGSHTQIDVDVYYSDAWHDALTGTGYTNADWTTIDLGGDYYVSSLRFRQLISGTSYAQLYEADFSKTEAYSVATDTHTISQTTSNNARHLSSTWGTRGGAYIDDVPACTITSATFSLAKVLTPTGTATIRVRSAATDAVLGTLGTLDVSTLTISYVKHTFTGTVVVPTMQDIRLSVEYSGGNATAYIKYRFQNTNVQAGTHEFYYTTSYVEGTTYDIDFSVSYTATVTSGEQEVSLSYVANILTNTSFEVGAPPTGWPVAGAGATAARSSTQAKFGTYSLALTRGGADCNVGQAISSPISYQGKTLTLGVWVYASVASRTRVAIAGDVSGILYSSYHSGVAGWEYLTVSSTLTTDTALIAYLTLSNGDTTVYFDGAILIVGSTIPNGYNNFYISIDGAIVGEAAVDGNITVPDNANDTQFGSDATIYINSASFTKGGVERFTFDGWEYAATFTDASGNGNTATPSFRTTSSDADVSTTLGSIFPLTQPTAPAFAVGAGPDFFSTNITASGNVTTSDNYTVKDYPLKDVIESVADASGTPEQLPSVIIGTFILIIASMATSYFLKSHSEGSLFVKAVVSMVIMGILVALQIYDWWMLIFYCLFEQAIWFAAKERKT